MIAYELRINDFEPDFTIQKAKMPQNIWTKFANLWAASVD